MGKFTINKILSSLNFKKKGGEERGGAHARRDWGILLAIFTFLNVVVIIFSMYLFFQINEGTIFLVEREDVETTEVFDQTQLNETLLFYEKREQEFERLKNDTSRIPSVR